MVKKTEHQLETFRKKLNKIIFGTDTRTGKLFDIVLLWTILLSIIVVMLDSVSSIVQKYGFYLFTIEWIFTILFTIEYSLRLYVSPKPHKYAFSFFGFIDLLAVLPTYLSLIFTGSQYLLVIRIVRLLRIFRIFKLVRYSQAAKFLIEGLKKSKPKIAVFLGTVLIVVIIMGAIMYLIEGEENGFTSIPKSIYWAIVTLTTVGYGDIAPKTILGQSVAAIIMILGYSIIAVPTGIVTVSLASLQQDQEKTKNRLFCPRCGEEFHDNNARYCKICSKKLDIK